MRFDRSKFITKPAWVRYSLAVVFVTIALILTNVLWMIVDRPVSAPLFLAAIVLSAWLCGFRVGLFASVLGGISIDYFFVSPYFSFTGDRDELVRLAVFVFEGFILSGLIERLRIMRDG